MDLAKKVVLLAVCFHTDAAKNPKSARDIFSRVKRALSEKPAGIDPALELKLSLHKYFFLICLKEKRASELSEAVDFLFNDPAYALFLKTLAESIEASRLRKQGPYAVLDSASFNSVLVKFLILKTLSDPKLKILSPRQSEILGLFRGLSGGVLKGTAVVRGKFDLSRERIKQIDCRCRRSIVENIETWTELPLEIKKLLWPEFEN